MKPEPPPPRWVYAPGEVAILGAPDGRIGRSQGPQLAPSLGIVGDVRVPLRQGTPWAVPGGTQALAIVYGLEGVRTAIELIEVDGGRVVWRDTAACAGPVVGVTEDVVVCTDGKGVRGVGLDGKQRWTREGAYIAMTEDRVVIAGPGEAVVHDAASGDELTRVKLPATVMIDAVLASCGDAGRELFAAGQDGKLTRIAEGKGGPAVSWAVPIGKIDELEACTGDTVLVREAGIEGGTLVALARATGQVTGRVPDVHGYWKARDGSDRLEIARATGLSTWPRDLVVAPAGPPLTTSTLALGQLLGERGNQRLVRASELTAVLLDRDGVRAYVPFGDVAAVLGENAIVSASWNGAANQHVRRTGIPRRYRKELRLPARRGGVAVAAELRDLPALEPLEVESVIAKPDTGKHAVLDVAVDPNDSAVVYTLQLERPDDETGAPGVASVDLAKRVWRWLRADACGTGESAGFAIARDVIVCATRTRTVPGAIVRATSRNGAARWEWEGDGIDRIEAAGDAVLVFDAAQLLVLDAASGKLRGRIASDDGARMRAAAISVGATTFVVAYERGRVVARIAAGMLPVWSFAVDGVVETIARSADGALVSLEDGDAYRIDLPAGTVHPLPGLNLEWRAPGDLVAASTAGGPIPATGVNPVASISGPGIVLPAPTPPKLRVLAPLGRRRPAPVEQDPERPRMWTPIPSPPPLGDSWQLTLFELAGGVRARNEYGLFPPIAPARERGPAGSPLVVASSPGLREVLVIDPRDGDPLRRVQLADDAAPGLVFGTIVDGTPVAGAILQAPLRVVIF